ncbi:hypothetical protein Scinn_51590 [Streptomyces virginiae]|uniref:Uncharacterized protein n=1 Tax=Streptomyces virginiae TaxID=1961 RepID=A0ABQ3NSF2_STRVG|nr:hypothetical protein Scinn_51590 [Streptomyces virginiae]
MWAEQHGGGAEAVGGLVQGAVAGIAGGGLGSAVTADTHGDGLHRVEAERGHADDDLGGALVGAVLQAVVDGDAAGPDAEFGGLEGEGRGEGHGVGAAGAGDEHEWRGARAGARVGAGEGSGRGPGAVGELGEDVVEYAADRQAYRRDRRMGTHVRCPSMEFGCLGGFGVVCWGVLARLPPRNGGCHSECVDGDRTEPFPEHRTALYGSRSLGRVMLLPPVRHV